MAETENSTAGDEQPATPEVLDDPNAPQAGDEPDGTVPVAPRGYEGRPGWVWVQNNTSGRRFDVREDRLRHMENVTPVKDVPVHYGDSARQPKARLDLRQLGGLKEKVATQSRSPRRAGQ